MRAGQDGQGGKRGWRLIGNLPRKARTPIVAGEVEPTAWLTKRGGDGAGVVQEVIDAVGGVICWIWPRARGVAPLVRGGGSVAGLAEGLDLGIPQVTGDAKTMQHQNQGSVGRAGDGDVEVEAGGGLNKMRGYHAGPRD